MYRESNREIRRNARPVLTDTVENMEAYDIVFVGYPVWDAVHERFDSLEEVPDSFHFN